MVKRMGVFHMSEQYTTGVVVTGKVTGIQDYGAFVALDAETQGLVHISEITNGYVKDIHDFLKVGDTVEVKVLSIDEEHRKMSLSLKAAKKKNKDGFLYRIHLRKDLIRCEEKANRMD